MTNIFVLNYRSVPFYSSLLSILGTLLVLAPFVWIQPSLRPSESGLFQCVSSMYSSSCSLCNYYNKYVHHFAWLAAPLSDLLCKGTVWHWSLVKQSAFDQLWEALVTPPILYLPTLDLPFILYTDASDTHVGAVLE